MTKNKKKYSDLKNKYVYVTLKSGMPRNGRFLRETDEEIIIQGRNGKESRIEKDDISVIDVNKGDGHE